MRATDKPDAWLQLIDSIPEPVQWLLYVLSGGILALLVWLYRREVRNRERIERQVHARIDRLEYHINQRLDEMNTHLIDIARNTR